MKRIQLFLAISAILLLSIGIYLGWLDNGQKPYQGYYHTNAKNN